MAVTGFDDAIVAFSALVSRLSRGEALGYVGAVLSIFANSMRTMIPLRCVGIAANIVFISYGLINGVYPTLFLHGVLLPLNTSRFVQMLRLVRSVKEAAACGDVSMDWLKPFMSKEAVRCGEVLFRKGDAAERLFYTLSGSYRLRESGIEIPRGRLVGELGFLTPDKCRTQTLECIEAGEVLSLTYDQLRQLYPPESNVWVLLPASHNGPPFRQHRQP